jgi:transposase
MPPKRAKLKPFSWVKRNGTLTPFLEGVLFGLHLQGASASDIADRLCVGRNTVYDVIGSVERRLVEECSPKRHDSDSTSEEEDVVSPAVEARRKEIVQLMQEKDDDGQYRIQTSKALRLRLSVHVCSRTINRDLLALGFQWRARPRVPALSDLQKQKRLAMVDTLLAHDIDTLLFSDESLFDCNDVTDREWCRPNEEPSVRPTERWTAKSHVWGVIGVSFRLLVFLTEDRVTTENYQHTLKTFLLPKLKTHHVFMQDNAPAHRAKATQDFLQAHGVTVADWPPHSPDLNPIENVWGLMKKALAINVHASTEELQDAISDVWFGISDESIANLVRSFPERVRTMSVNEGGPVVRKRSRASSER